MNKILMINNMKKFKNIIIDNSDNLLEINDNTHITIFNSQINSLTIKISEGFEVIVDDFREIDETSTQINIETSENTKTIYNHAFINNKTYNLNIKINMINNNAQCELNINGINDKGTSVINIDGIIDKTNYNNEFLENVNLININKGKGTCIPNILIGNSKVSANHQVTIGKINNNELEYLMSKGLSKKTAQKLILNGFLINKLIDKNLIIRIKEIFK